MTVQIRGTATSGAPTKNAAGASKKQTGRSRRILWAAGTGVVSGLAGTADEVAHPGVLAPTVSLIDAEMLAREIGTEADSPGMATSREHEDRLAFLRRQAGRPGGVSRRQFMADGNTVRRLQALGIEAPNAARVVDVAERAALLSWHAGSPFRMPPILIVGPPGTGKSRIARRLAEALGTTMTTIDGPMMADRGPLTGHDPGYRGSGPGKIASALLEGPSASPLVLLDEVDKVRGYHESRPLDALLPLLESTTARAFSDSYISLPMRADGVIWAMTANAIADLPAPLLDRVIVVEMPRLGDAESREVVGRLFADVLATHGLPPAQLGEAVLDRLASRGLREVRQILGLALGPALSAGRAAPDVADLEGAMTLVTAGRRRGEKGEGSGSGLKAPVGFVAFVSADDRAPERDTLA